MPARQLDGRILAQKLRQDCKEQVLKLQNQGAPIPGLAVIQVGLDPASSLYVGKKREACEEVGIRSFAHNLPVSATQQELEQLIHTLNQDPSVHGILLQLPLPSHLNAVALLDQIVPHKDVDGFHPYNLGRLAQRRPSLRPCTPYGIIQLLSYHGIAVKGAHAVVVGASNIVGRPMALEMLLAGATTTICHRFTDPLPQYVSAADIIVVAVGKPNFIEGDWIRPGSVVVDVGINRLPDGRVVGDVAYAKASERAAWITPVPGGVGPMTVAVLLQNTLQAAAGTRL